MLKNMMKVCAVASPLMTGFGAADAKAFTLHDPFLRAFAGIPQEATTFSTVETSIRKTKEGYILRMALPGFQKSDVKVSLEKDNTLHIKAERKEEEKQKGEVVFGNLSLSQLVDETFQLGNKVDSSTIKASMEHGILTIEMKEDKKQVGVREIKIS